MYISYVCIQHVFPFDLTPTRIDIQYYKNKNVQPLSCLPHLAKTDVFKSAIIVLFLGKHDPSIQSFIQISLEGIEWVDKRARAGKDKGFSLYLRTLSPFHISIPNNERF